MDHDNTHSVSVIIDDHGRALLTQRRDNGHWEAPGGVLERDEDITRLHEYRRCGAPGGRP
ncbi:NUDIX domain-containing protein [Streptosporangium soli]